MSWGFTFAAKDKEQAKAEIDRIAIVLNGGVPSGIAEILKGQIDSCRAPTEREGLLIESSGHIDSRNPGANMYTNHGEAKMKVSIITLILALLFFAPPALAQEGPKFGGCLKNAETCFGPTVSVNVIALSIKSGDVTSTFDPGIGYGATFWAKQWYKTGVSASVAFPQYAGTKRISPSLLFSFAEYARIGFACPLWTSGGLKENGQILLGFGSDLGKW